MRNSSLWNRNFVHIYKKKNIYDLKILFLQIIITILEKKLFLKLILLIKTLILHNGYFKTEKSKFSLNMTTL